MLNFQQLQGAISEYKEIFHCEGYDYVETAGGTMDAP